VKPIRLGLGNEYSWSRRRRMTYSLNYIYCGSY